MALSEDAIAIVAAQLTAAVCALEAPYRPKQGDETAMQVVDRLFADYLKKVHAGRFSHYEKTL